MPRPPEPDPHTNDPDQIALDVINHCVFGRLRQINRVVTAHYDQELRDFGVTANQITILAVVTVLEQATPSALQPYLQMDVSTISRNVKRMIEKSWLAVIPGEDRRSHSLVAAPAGRDLLRQARPAWMRAQRWAYEMFGADAIAAVRKLATTANPVIPE